MSFFKRFVKVFSKGKDDDKKDDGGKRKARDIAGEKSVEITGHEEACKNKGESMRENKAQNHNLTPNTDTERKFEPKDEDDDLWEDAVEDPIKDAIVSDVHRPEREEEADSYEEDDDSSDSDTDTPKKVYIKHLQIGKDNVMVTGKYTPDIATDKIDDTERSLPEILEDVKFWADDPNLYSNCCRYLQELWDTVKTINIKKGNFKFWIKILKTNMTLADFFIRITKLEEKHGDCNFDTARLFLNRLIHPAGIDNYPNRDILKSWLDANQTNEKLKSELTCGEIFSVESLLQVLKTRFLPPLKTQESIQNYEKECDKEVFDAFITDQVALSVKVLYEQLQKRKDSINETFMNIILYQLAYNKTYSGFDILLTTSKLEKFVEEGEKMLELFTFQEMLRQQAFLIHAAISCVESLHEHSRQERIFRDLIQPTYDKINRRLFRLISTNTRHGRIDFISLKSKLQKIIENENEDFSQQLDLSLLHNSLTVESGKDTDEINDSNYPIEQNEKSDTLAFLGLQPYFPEKITVKDVMSVLQSEMPKDKSCNIPWIFLRRIFMLDRTTRDDVVADYFESSALENPDLLSGDLDSFLDSNEETKPDIHPLDIFVAIFSCCNPILKQILIQKMTLCQLAIPLIYRPLLCKRQFISIWPLRTLKFEGMTLPIVKERCRYAAFCRLKRPAVSKSELMGMVLSEQHRNIFCHQNCPLGRTPRKDANGLVEASWYIPSNKSSDKIGESVTFCNLRGDAIEHVDQISFLGDVSSIVFVAVDVQDLLDISCIDVLLSLYKFSSTIVLLLTSKIPEKEFKSVIQKYTQIQGINKKKTKLVQLSKEGREENTETLKQVIKSHIKSCISDKKGISLEECKTKASKYNILVDEEGNNCSVGKRLSKDIFKSMDDGGDSEEAFKQRNVPLQGDLWAKWTETAKRQSKVGGPGKNSQIHNDDLLHDMKTLRNEQAKKCSRPPPIMTKLIETLVLYQDFPDILIYILTWLAIFFEEKFGSASSELRKRYKDLLSSKAAKDKKTKQDLENKMQNEFGVQHLIREIGQIYESIVETTEVVGKETLEAIEILPSVVAKLIIQGYAIEIMDGDNANIPMNWVKAIFSSLKSMTNNAKILAVSVVGVQSSGKSTLLNTMFGSKFNVSAGRCTKGVFMQLIPVDNCEYQYIMVLDTEGLRSEESTSASVYDNDNKLATFVIGMSDITLVNIKGENYAEFKDVLQIVVHAFLRLNLANNNLNLKQLCVFCHQNVSAVDADDRNVLGRQKFLETLNEMTKEAADQEGIQNISEFRQVIEFDILEHCYYFENLWNGNPPMAAVNQEYSAKVNEVKQNVTHKFAETIKKKNFFHVSDFELHTEDLWEGILSDKFIFSFRNSIEIKAYSILECRYNSLKFDLQESVFNLVQSQAPELKWHSNTQENKKNIDSILLTLVTRIKDKADDTKRTFEEFVDESEFYEILMNWKQPKLLAIEGLVSSLIEKSTKQMKEIQDQKRLDSKQTQMDKELEMQVSKIAKQFFEKMNPEIPLEEQLQPGFEKEWIKLGHQWASRELTCVTSLEDEVYKQLSSHFNSQSPLLKKELKKQPLKLSAQFTKLEGSIFSNEIEKKHLSIKQKFSVKDFKNIKERPRNQCVIETVSLTDKALRKIDRYLDTISQQYDTKFDPSFINTILKYIDEEIDEYNKYSEQHHFSILASYKVKLSVHVCRHALNIFMRMNEQYDDKHNTSNWFHKQKAKLNVLFRTIVCNRTEEYFAASMICSAIEDALHRKLAQKLPTEIETDAMIHFSYSKSILLSEIMMDLQQKENISLYQEYIKNPNIYALNWITAFIKKKMGTKENQEKSTRFAEIVLTLISQDISTIEKSILSATESVKREKGMGIKNYIWMDNFKEGIDDKINIAEESLQKVVERKIVDFSNFESEIMKQLEQVQNRITKEFESGTKFDSSKVSKRVTEKLWGCTALCPFCNEPCKHTDKDHIQQNIKHSCLQHRPLAIKGVTADDELIIEPCTRLVENDRRCFQCSWCNYECHPRDSNSPNRNLQHRFDEVRSIFPRWEIRPSNKLDSFGYWCCFMADYGYILKQLYSSNLPDIPRSWKSYDHKKAEKSLSKAVK